MSNALVQVSNRFRQLELWCHSVVRSLGRSLARSLDRPIAQSLGRPLGRSVACSIGRSLRRSLGLVVAHSLAGSAANPSRKGFRQSSLCKYDLLTRGCSIEHVQTKFIRQSSLTEMHNKYCVESSDIQGAHARPPTPFYEIGDWQA